MLGGANRFFDPADRPAASYRPDLAQQLDTPRDHLAEALHQHEPTDELLDAVLAWHSQREHDDLQAQLGKLLGKLLPLLIERDRIDVAVWALAYAGHLTYTSGQTASEIATRLRITESDFSKTVNEFCDMLCLPRPPALKSAAARESYSKAQKENHWRGRTGLDFIRRRTPPR